MCSISRALEDLDCERPKIGGLVIPSLIALPAVLLGIVVLRVIDYVREGDARSPIEIAAIALASLIRIALAAR